MCDCVYGVVRCVWVVCVVFVPYFVCVVSVFDMVFM